MLPVEDPNGDMSWDTGRGGPVRQIGEQINHYCVEAMGLPVSGSGGIERCGKLFLLSMSEELE